jgi:hypothetical protein
MPKSWRPSVQQSITSSKTNKQQALSSAGPHFFIRLKETGSVWKRGDPDQERLAQKRKRLPETIPEQIAGTAAADRDQFQSN